MRRTVMRIVYLSVFNRRCRAFNAFMRLLQTSFLISRNTQHGPVYSEVSSSQPLQGVSFLFSFSFSFLLVLLIKNRVLTQTFRNCLVQILLLQPFLRENTVTVFVSSIAKNSHHIRTLRQCLSHLHCCNNV